MALRFQPDQPIYLQVARMIRNAILAGELPEGEAIPSVRQVSAEQGLNPQTVLNATRQLVEEGLLEKRRGLGIFVAAGATKKLRNLELQRYRDYDVPRLIEQAQLLGISSTELIKLIQEAYTS